MDVLANCPSVGRTSFFICLKNYWKKKFRIWPELELAVKHPYIKSRLEQEKIALSFALTSDQKLAQNPQSSPFEVYIIEIPYVFGTQPGRKPVWAFFVELIRSMPLATFYAKGGTAAVTARQVGEAISGAAEGRGEPGSVPLGWFDLTWKEMFKMIHFAMGQPKRKVISVPKMFFKLGASSRMKSTAKRGLESGLKLVDFTDVMYREAFIPKEAGAEQIGVTDDDLQKAIYDSIKLSLDFIDGKTKGVEMKL